MMRLSVPRHLSREERKARAVWVGVSLVGLCLGLALFCAGVRAALGAM